MEGIRGKYILPPIRSPDTKKNGTRDPRKKDGLCPKLVLVDEKLANANETSWTPTLDRGWGFCASLLLL